MQAYLTRREQMSRRRLERCWAARAARGIRVTSGAEDASSTLHGKRVDPTKPAQMIHGLSHVITQGKVHGVKALRIVQLNHRYSLVGVDADANECA